MTRIYSTRDGELLTSETASYFTDYLVIAATGSEYSEVLKSLQEVLGPPAMITSSKASGVSYDTWLRTKDWPQIVLLQMNDQTRVRAACLTDAALRDWSPEYVVLLGIAGYVHRPDRKPDDKVQLYDVVIPVKIVDYSHLKLRPFSILQKLDTPAEWKAACCEAIEFNTDEPGGLIQPTLVQRCARRLREQQNAIKKRVAEFPDTFKLRVVSDKYIMTGDWKIDSPESIPALKAFIERDANKNIIAVEMESGGVLQACKRAKHQPAVVVLKVMSDATEKTARPEDEKKDRSLAVRLAAECLVELLTPGPAPPLPLIRKAGGASLRRPLIVAVDHARSFLASNLPLLMVCEFRPSYTDFAVDISEQAEHEVIWVHPGSPIGTTREPFWRDEKDKLTEWDRAFRKLPPPKARVVVFESEADREAYKTDDSPRKREFQKCHDAGTLLLTTSEIIKTKFGVRPRKNLLDVGIAACESQCADGIVFCALDEEAVTNQAARTRVCAMPVSCEVDRVVEGSLKAVLSELRPYVRLFRNVAGKIGGAPYMGGDGLEAYNG